MTGKSDKSGLFSSTTAFIVKSAHSHYTNKSQPSKDLQKIEMNRTIAAAIFILIYVKVHSFDVKSFQVSMRHGDIQKVHEGQYVDLSCQADNWWEFCRFTSPSGLYCELKWDREH